MAGLVGRESSRSSSSRTRRCFWRSSGDVATARVGTVHDVGRSVFIIGLAIWAGEETTHGVNWFRRLLGVGGLVWVVFTLAGEL